MVKVSMTLISMMVLVLIINYDVSYLNSGSLFIGRAGSVTTISFYMTQPRELLCIRGH